MERRGRGGEEGRGGGLTQRLCAVSLFKTTTTTTNTRAIDINSSGAETHSHLLVLPPRSVSTSLRVSPSIHTAPRRSTMSLSGSQTPEDGLYGSWVELEELIAAVSRRESLTGSQESISSALQGELERILLEAQLECERSRDSPPQALTPQPIGSPRPASEHDSDCVTIQEDGERRDTDWVWDWSSRPENMPPKEFVFQHPKQPGSLSVRKTEVMKKGIFSSDVLLILGPTLLASHLLTLGVGIYIGKRLAASSTSTL